MNNLHGLMEKIKIGNVSWKDYFELLNLEDDDKLNSFFHLAQKIRAQNFKNQLKIYIPNKRFPAISVTGNKCELSCLHCNKKYLEGMKPILKPIDLEKFLLYHSKNNGVGALISGGCDEDGAVPLKNFLNVIKKVKNQTNLIINTHTGLLDEETAKKLADSRVDIVSFDINIDEEIIHNIYQLEKNLEDYETAIDLLKKYNLNIVPHICIGLYYGKLHKELDSIKFIKQNLIKPSLIVLIVLIPPANSGEVINKFETPNPVDIAKIIAVTRFAFPKTEISLGCMRPKGSLKFEMEKYAIRAGINRIEIPSKKVLDWTKQNFHGISFKFYSACCAIPEKFEKFAESIDIDIKRYLEFL